jgi:cell division protein FtsI (penicillin-binding protein 3)
VRQASAKAGTCIVMDPRTGEVYAMASVTRDGFHGFTKDEDANKNRALEVAYEPGSIFKLVTISGALADGIVKPSTRVPCPYKIHIADRWVHDSHEHGLENYTVSDIIKYSSNVGAVKIGVSMGKDELFKWIKAYGFGKTTGIQWPAWSESPGIVHPVDQWSGSSIGNIPMGQGISVTAMQMASAFSAVACNGWQVKPRLVLQVGAKVDDKVEKHRVIRAKVAKQVRAMLVRAVEEDLGTGVAARIPGYVVGGKTGTAEIPSAGGYLDDSYVSSFIGMVPAARPRLVCLVAVDSTPMFGGEAAAPAFQKIVSFCLQRLEIAP